MITRQGLRVYRDALDARNDPRGRPYYWIGGDFPTGVDEDGTDFGALSAGYVSITPLQLDLTDRPALRRSQDLGVVDHVIHLSRPIPTCSTPVFGRSYARSRRARSWPTGRSAR